MIADLDLTPTLIKKFGAKKRTIGRYSVSDLYAIQAGWITKENFLSPEPPDFEAVKRMWNGTITHDFIEGMLDREKCERKVVYPYKDIEVVGKADYLHNENELWDFKTSAKEMYEVKPWYRLQLLAYCSMFKRSRGIIYQPIIGDEKILLKFIGDVQRDDGEFERVLESLYKFHIRLVTYDYEQKNKQSPLI